MPLPRPLIFLLLQDLASREIPENLGSTWLENFHWEKREIKSTRRKLKSWNPKKWGQFLRNADPGWSREVWQEFGTMRRMQLSRRSQKSLFRVNISPKFGQSMNKNWIWLLSFPESPNTLAENSRLRCWPPPLCETPSRGGKNCGDFWEVLRYFIPFLLAGGG